MEKAYKKVWINSDWRARVIKGLDRIDEALNLLEPVVPGCTERYLTLTSSSFRREVAYTAGDAKVSVFQIYSWLKELFRTKEGHPYKKLADYIDKCSTRKVSHAVKEAAKHEVKSKICRKSVTKIRKAPLPLKNRAIRGRIPAYEKRTEDYINGVKYRVIVYFGRNVR